MKTQETGRQLNNKGLSLVEVIIAMVILSIVVAATMRLFVSSTGYNVRSRDKQRAIAVAESAMESFKAYHLKELCQQFEAGSFKGVSYDPTTTTWSVTARNGAAAVSPILDSEKETDPSITNYEFLIGNAVEENKYYDVKINVALAKKERVTQIKDMNPYRDVICLLEESDASEGMAQIVDVAKAEIGLISPPSDLVSGASLALSDVTLSTLERTIALSAETDGTADKMKLEVTYSYNGTYSYTYPATTGGGGSGTTKTVSGVAFVGSVKKILEPATGADFKLVYDNTDTVAAADGSGSIKNVYLYYYPLYSDTMSGVISARDKIHVDCSALPGEVDVHVAKQKATLYTDTALAIYEAGYYVQMDLAGNASLQHNLDKGFVATAIPTPTLNGGVNPARTLEDGTLTRQEKGVLYDVEVVVYNAGDTTTELASFVGTMND